jgi:flagellar basal-body rod protein FlgG
MPLRALSIATTGGMALQNRIDTIANNLANVNTTAYKRTRSNFADLLYQHIQMAGFGTIGQNMKPTGLSFGTGVKLVSTEKLFTQGDLTRTDRDLDVAIEGEGFLRVVLPGGAGQYAYTRAGNLNIDRDGRLVTAEGYLIDPAITVPTNVTRVSIDVTGKVQGFDPVTPEVLQDIGQLELTRFVNPSGLQSIGDNLYVETLASGTRVDGLPGQAGFGNIRQGYLEESNVDVIRELVDLIQTQRAFEINNNSITASDQILQAITALRR